MATDLPDERPRDRPTNRATARSAADTPELRLYTHTAAMTGGLFWGLGGGGFIDGIVFHQIAQWHNMGSAILPPVTMAAMSQNMLWDGLFHILALALTLIGALALWREGQDGTAPPRLRVLLGQMLLGWGLFNLVEGVVDHHPRAAPRPRHAAARAALRLGLPRRRRISVHRDRLADGAYDGNRLSLLSRRNAGPFPRARPARL